MLGDVHLAGSIGQLGSGPVWAGPPGQRSSGWDGSGASRGRSSPSGLDETTPGLNRSQEGSGTLIASDGVELTLAGWLVGGRRRIRTSVGVSRRLYRPLPLAARASSREPSEDNKARCAPRPPAGSASSRRS